MKQDRLYYVATHQVDGWIGRPNIWANADFDTEEGKRKEGKEQVAFRFRSSPHSFRDCEFASRRKTNGTYDDIETARSHKNVIQ